MKPTYQVLLVDPPWQYRNKNTGGSMISGSANKYPTMTLEKIKRMAPSIQKLMEKDASYLFLWATSPLLPECLEVMNAWNYQYKSSIAWIKLGRIGMGWWFRVNTEYLLIGCNGKKVKPFKSNRRNHISTYPRQHSRKPDEIYSLIEDATPGMRRAELFAREKHPGWDVWGNQVDCDFAFEIDPSS